MNNIMDSLPQTYGLILLANSILIVLLLGIGGYTFIKLRKMAKKYTKFMQGYKEGNLEQLIESCVNSVHEVKLKNKEVQAKINDFERGLMQSIQKVGVIRYNAFDNVGSDLSFAIALLDSNDNGVVISGVYSRDNSVTYAKVIEGGRSRHSMSAEEIQAIDKAKRSHGERGYMNTKHIS